MFEINLKNFIKRVNNEEKGSVTLLTSFSLPKSVSPRTFGRSQHPVSYTENRANLLNVLK